MKTSDKWQVTSDKKLRASQSRRLAAFTLIELLVVIAILALLAGLAVPALKNLGKSNASLSASRQLLDELAHARQLAVSRHTTVYMIFVPTNFWGNATWFGGLSAAQKTVVTNLVDKQLTGYNFAAYGAAGDQPGQHQWHFLEPWQALPAGNFISPFKFLVVNSALLPLNIPQWVSDYGRPAIPAFTNVYIPFPTEQSPGLYLPCVAFDYSGKLVYPVSGDEYIPLVQGSVSYGIDVTTKVPQLTTVAPGSITEIPPGNGTNIGYNIIHIDALSGRAVLEFHKIGP